MTLKRKKLKNRQKHGSEKFWSYYDGPMICTYCNAFVSRFMIDKDPYKATVDHIIPVSKGGTNAKANLTLACFECNSKKGNS